MFTAETQGLILRQKLFRLDGDASIELLNELELEQDADAPMSMAVDLEVRTELNPYAPDIAHFNYFRASILSAE